MRRPVRLLALHLVALAVVACAGPPETPPTPHAEPQAPAVSGGVMPVAGAGRASVGEPPIPIVPTHRHQVIAGTDETGGDGAPSPVPPDEIQTAESADAEPPGDPSPSPAAADAGRVAEPDGDPSPTPSPEPQPAGDLDAQAAAPSPAPALGFCDTVTQIPVEECEALAALYDSTDGDHWTNNTGWLVTTTPCTWFGVTCTEGHVTQLSLLKNQLNGPIPPRLGDLAGLRYLYLGNNQLNGSIPPELGNLASLEDLEVWGNDLSGSIPPELGNLANLEDLDLWGNDLSGSIPPELGNLASLCYLELWDNELSGSIPPELGDLPTLRYLMLSGNHLSGSIPPKLGDLVTLWLVDLSDNRLEGSIPSELGRLGALWTLELQNNRLGGEIPPELADLTALYVDGLDLGYNMLTATDPALVAFLGDKDPDWADTQTVAPDDVLATVTGTDFTAADIELIWMPILYQDDGGCYEVSVAPAPGGPYAVAGVTVDKSASGYTISGLEVGARYYLLVRAFTPAHGDQQNDLWSRYSYAFVVLPEIVFTRVEKVEVAFDGTTPVLAVEGVHPDGCGGRVTVEQEQAGNDVTIDIYREQNPGKVCPAGAKPYGDTIRLEGTYASGLMYAIYINGEHVLDIVIP